LVLNEIKTAKLAYHTYPVPNKEKPRLTLKGIPPNVETEEIMGELTQLRLQVDSIRQITRRDKTTSQILQQYPVFIVTFREGTDLREVYKIKNLCRCIIKWEKYRAKRPIQQCFNCQKYGHSSTYCGLPAKCVKCKQAHQTQSCQKPPSEPPACVNCGGEHPANYTGCPVYQKVLEARTRKRIPPPQREHHNKPQHGRLSHNSDTTRGTTVQSVRGPKWRPKTKTARKRHSCRHSSEH
jgi:PAX-interacting protein 1